MCNIEKRIKNFFEKHAECKDCNRKRGKDVATILKIKYQTDERHIMKKNNFKKYYRNKMIDIYILKT